MGKLSQPPFSAKGASLWTRRLLLLFLLIFDCAYDKSTYLDLSLPTGVSRGSHKVSGKRRLKQNLKLPPNIAILSCMKRVTSHNMPSTLLSSEWHWPTSLDALVAAPEHLRKILENDRVRVLEVCIPRGETVPVHTHVAGYSLSAELERPCAARRDG